MSLFIFARFEPRPGMRDDLRNLLMEAVEPTRAESGCIRINLYEANSGPCCFFIHSEWADETAFEAHARMPHILRLAARVEDVATHSLQAARTVRVL
jgi:quinol monooxygenase YgiN